MPLLPLKVDVHVTGQDMPAWVQHFLLPMLHDIKCQGLEIMAKLGDFATRVNTAFDTLHKSVEGIQGDVLWLKGQIAELQSSADILEPEDQAVLDGIEARLTHLAAKLGELDSQTATPPTE